MFGGGQPKKDVIHVPKLEPMDLYDRRKRRDFARLRSYNILLQQIYHRIYSSSQLPISTCSVLYTVPPFIIGLPKIDMEDCIVYIVFQLRQSGFEVKFTWPNVLYISWKHHEGAYITNQNPIVQAMLREAESNTKISEKKKPAIKKDVKFNEAINFLLNSSTPSDSYASASASASSSATAPAPPRTPADYKPPESFLKTMDRPGPGRTLHPISGAQQTAKSSVLADLWSI